MYVKEYLCKGCLEFRTLEHYQNQSDDFCKGCNDEDLCYCPGCDQHKEVECFEDASILCWDCLGEEEECIEENQDPWSIALEALREIAKECHTDHCLWVHQDVDDGDYFFAPSSRFHPHARCTNQQPREKIVGA